MSQQNDDEDQPAAAALGEEGSDLRSHPSDATATAARRVEGSHFKCDPSDSAATAAARDDETAIVQPTTGEAPALAWSLDDDAEGPAHRSWGVAWGVVAALVVGAAALVAAVGAIAWMMRSASPPAPAAQTAATSATAAPAPPTSSAAITAPAATSTTTAAPTTVTVTESPASTVTHAAIPTPTKTAEISTTAAEDRQFLARLTADGWTVTDPDIMLINAHGVCRRFKNGDSPPAIYQELAARTGITINDALNFTTAVLVTYSDC